MNKTSFMLQIIRNDAQWHAMKYAIVEICNHGMHGALVLVPVISLDFILHHIMIIFSKVQECDIFYLYYFFFPLFEILSLALFDDGVCCKVSTMYTSNLMKSFTSAVYVCSFVLLTRSHFTIKTLLTDFLLFLFYCKNSIKSLGISRQKRRSSQDWLHI